MGAKQTFCCHSLRAAWPRREHLTRAPGGAGSARGAPGARGGAVGPLAEPARCHPSNFSTRRAGESAQARMQGRRAAGRGERGAGREREPLAARMRPASGLGPAPGWVRGASSPPAPPRPSRVGPRESQPRPPDGPAPARSRVPRPRCGGSRWGFGPRRLRSERPGSLGSRGVLPEERLWRPGSSNFKFGRSPRNPVLRFGGCLEPGRV